MKTRMVPNSFRNEIDMSLVFPLYFFDMHWLFNAEASILIALMTE